MPRAGHPATRPTHARKRARTQSRATNNTACAPCEPGTFAASIGFGAYTPCPQGTYQPTDGEDECVACPEGSTTLGLGAASVDECRCKASFYNERQFQAGEGNVTDAVCLLGFDSSKVNLDDLSLCGAPPEDLDAVVTASAPCPLACPFQDGALCVRCAAPASCLQCPEGGSCACFEQLSPTLAVDGAPKNLAGYWGDPRFPTTFYTCKEDRCDSDFSCYEGYAGTMCEACADGFYAPRAGQLGTSSRAPRGRWWQARGRDSGRHRTRRLRPPADPR